MAELERDLEKLMRETYPGEDKVLVFGEGNSSSSVMLIGEAPGEQETLARRPFVGKAGKNLNEFLESVRLDRGELYVTNAVKFRPTKRSAAGRTVNRPPTQEEVRLFLPYLLREIRDLSPRVVVTLGNVPLKALLGSRAVIGDLHGSFLKFEGRLLYPMYHPASLIYNPSLKAVYAEDMQRFAEWLSHNN